jgi:hypothetical protein
MLAELVAAALVPATTVAGLVGVYLWSDDEERRRRALRLLELLLRRGA